MPTYKILGSDKNSGEAVAITLDAADKQQARLAAENQNIQISTIKDFDARNRDTVEPPRQPEKKKLKLDETKRAKKPARSMRRLAILIIILILIIAGWYFFSNSSIAS